MKVVIVIVCTLLSALAFSEQKSVELDLGEGASTGLTEFIDGFVNGFKTSNSETICLLSIQEVNGQFDEIVQYLLQFFNTGNFNNVWFALRELDSWASALDNALSDCNVSLLFTRIGELFTLQDIPAIGGRYALNYNDLIEDWQQFTSNFGSDWNATGEALGNILSITLNYSI